jgi:hypothetical protein
VRLAELERVWWDYGPHWIFKMKRDALFARSESDKLKRFAAGLVLRPQITGTERRPLARKESTWRLLIFGPRISYQFAIQYRI